ncbi:MAG: hypothetical protein IPK71_21950 [Myxococcales bacterium]|nr:hypothetical protein [Myxococcales bacterium]
MRDERKPRRRRMITGGLPETGFRLVLERPRDDDRLPCTYSGRVELPGATLSTVARVSASGDVAVELDASAHAPAGLDVEALREKVRLLVRQVVKGHEGDAPLARKIVRWRGEK